MALSWINGYNNIDYLNKMIRGVEDTLSNDYNDLDNIPIIKIVSSTSNPQNIWELKEGMYLIDGIVYVDNNTSYEVSNLFVSMTARLENGKYVLSAFIPFLKGLYEYILKSNSTEYEEHQIVILATHERMLTRYNETPYEPNGDYNPATKKYVDDKANEIITELDNMGVNKETTTSLKEKNRIRDIKLQALLNESSDRNISISEDTHYFDMPLSIDEGLVRINKIVGDTLVNVCDQEEPIAITKSYTVENENHIALQGEYDGSCRPIVHGNTLVNHNADWDGNLQTGVETSASGIEDVQVEGIKGQEVSVVVEGNTVLNHALGKTSAAVSSIESENEGNYVDLTVANDMSSVVEIEGRTMVNLMPNLSFRQNQTSQGQLWIYKYFTLNQPTKANAVYTLIFDVIENTAEVTMFHVGGKNDSFGLINMSISSAGRYIATATSNDEVYDHSQVFVQFQDIYEIGAFEVRIMIFEGDLTQTPGLIPNGYFEGLKSSYECEVAEDGKYKVDVKVTGKNKLNLPYTEQNKLYTNGDSWDSKFSFNVIKGKTYTFSLKSDFENVNGSNLIWALVWSSSYSTNPDNQIYKTTSVNTSYTFTSTKTGTVYFIGSLISGGNEFWDFQLEEGTVTTDYEPYIEYTKTFYLNSPLLEGDKIVTKNGKVYHYHKMGRVVLNGSRSWGIGSSGISSMARFCLNKTILNNYASTEGITTVICDKFVSSNGYGITSPRVWISSVSEGSKGDLNITKEIGGVITSHNDVASFKKWLQANPVTVVYELAKPYYELIDEYNNTILNIPKNVAHLTHTSAVPVNNTTFTNYKDELNVLEPNTQYRVMFDCDTANVPFAVTLGGTSRTVTSKKGTHSLLITTPSTLVDKNLVIDGIGRCGIDNIRIFKGNVECDYVKGLWSGYEERKLEKPELYVEEIQTSSKNGVNLGMIPLKPNTLYTIIYDIKSSNNINVDKILSILRIIPYNTPLTDNRHVYGYTGELTTSYQHVVAKLTSTGYVDAIYEVKLRNAYEDYKLNENTLIVRNFMILEGDWTDNPPTYEEVMANEGKYAVKVKLDTNATIFGKGGRL